MTDSQSPENITGGQLDRREFLRKGGAFVGGLVLGAGVGFVGGRLFPEQTPEVLEDERRDFETAKEVIGQFVNKDSDPKFWSEFDSLLNSDDQSKINDRIIRYSEKEDGSFEMHYFPHGATIGNPEVYIVVIEPHSAPNSWPEYKSRAVIISYDIDDEGRVIRSPGQQRATHDFSEQIIGDHFQTPKEMHQIPWRESGGSDRNSRIYPSHDKVSEYRYRESVNGNNIGLTVWYPEAESGPKPEIEIKPVERPTPKPPMA